ncbi:MAG TPA: hypothetical protein VF465_02660, partial [Flavobacterium sp.]|uniref:hypothetical protein n=1 Tax=Flavobacterium sp. TaxID=239 RepID=UPI002ECFDA30
MKNSVLKIIFFLPFSLIIFSLLEFVNPYKLIKYNIGFVSICITIATFSISFSFLQYQFSPYKALLRTISKRQLLFSYITLLIALIPLFSLFYNEKLVPTLGLICIPILSYFVILLVIIANEETNPIILIKRKNSKSSLANFIKNFKIADDKQIAEINKLEFSNPDETPMHDYGETNFKLIHTKNNPFSLICHTVSIALQNNDIEKFQSIIKIFFKLVN